MKIERKLRILDLFSGLHGWSKCWEDEGHIVIRVELNPKFDQDITIDILELTKDMVLEAFDGHAPDVILASPPCTAFSVASIGAHWTGGRRAYVPKTEFAVKSQKLVQHTLDLIKELGAPYWVIENPRGVLRKLPILENEIRETVFYCKYGEKRMKPTDLWVSAELREIWTPREKCRNFRYDENGEVIDRHCDHEPARRGARTGTQGMKGNADRSLIPAELAKDVMRAIVPTEPTKPTFISPRRVGSSMEFEINPTTQPENECEWISWSADVKEVGDVFTITPTKVLFKEDRFLLIDDENNVGTTVFATHHPNAKFTSSKPDGVRLANAIGRIFEVHGHVSAETLTIAINEAIENAPKKKPVVIKCERTEKGRLWTVEA